MDLGLKGKVAFVTGVGSKIGFGRAIAHELAKEGVNLVACSRGQKGVDECVEECKALGVDCIGIAYDVTDPQASIDAAKTAIDHFGKIDILVNNAGASKYQNKKFVEMSIEDIQFDVETNLYGQMYVAHAILPYMLEAGKGNIVNFAGGRGIPGLSCYGASKGGVIEWAYALAKEVGRAGIQVNVFGPGLSATGLTEEQSPKFMEMVSNSTAQGYLSTPDDVANYVVFLCSEKNSYMTGSMLHI